MRKVTFGNRIPSLEPVHVLLLAEVRFSPHPAMRHEAIRVYFTDSALAIEDLRVLLHFLPFTGRGRADVRDGYFLSIFLCRLPALPVSSVLMMPRMALLL